MILAYVCAYGLGAQDLNPARPVGAGRDRLSREITGEVILTMRLKRIKIVIVAIVSMAAIGVSFPTSASAAESAAETAKLEVAGGGGLGVFLSFRLYRFDERHPSAVHTFHTP